MRRTKREIMEGVEGVLWSILIANNTVRYVTSDGYDCIRLHRTDIVVRPPNCSFIILDTGGWFTATTKERINRFLPPHCKLFQDNFEWFIEADTFIHPYEDGMTISTDGYHIRYPNKFNKLGQQTLFDGRGYDR